jgi:uncharacterized protein (DUF2249 family)
MNNNSVSDPKNIFDGRSIPCSVKHGLIIQKWLGLEVGGYFVLVNDRDPVRMHEQFSVEWPGAFAWEYLQKGPEEFRVKITKLKATAPVAEVVECCGGH